MYAVTNRHLVEAGVTYARLNLPQGGTKVVALGQEDWVKHPNQDDIAVCSVDLDPQDHAFRYVGLEQLLSERLKNELGVGPGDECIIVGRFVGHDGRERNRPATRFGFVAMMPDRHNGLLTKQPGDTELRLEGYLVEGRSQGGFSGSPVFMHMPPWQLQHEEEGYSGRRDLWDKTGECSFLLGVTWSHFPDQLTARALDQDGRWTGETLRLELNSGMMCVAPAWKILEVLNLPELQEQRKEDRERYVRDGTIAD